MSTPSPERRDVHPDPEVSDRMAVGLPLLAAVVVSLGLWALIVLGLSALFRALGA